MDVHLLQLFTDLLRILSDTENVDAARIQNYIRILNSGVSFSHPGQTMLQITDTINKKLMKRERDHDAIRMNELTAQLSPKMLKNAPALLTLFYELANFSTVEVYQTSDISKQFVGDFSRLQSLLSPSKSSISSIEQPRKDLPVSFNRQFQSSLLFNSSLRPKSETISRPFTSHNPSIVLPDDSTSSSRQMSASSRPTKGNTSASYLAQPSARRVHRSKPAPTNAPPNSVTEQQLIRDLVFILQGIDGKFVHYQPHTDSFLIKTEASVSRPVHQAVLKLSEVGWLYRRIRRFLDSHSVKSADSVVVQSLSAAVNEHLTEYLRLVAILESQLSATTIDSTMQPKPGALTLKKLTLWLHEPAARLKVFASLLDAAKGRKGGSLASLVYDYTNQGDPVYKRCVLGILKLITRPIYTQIINWMYDGALIDGFHEFFVSCDVNSRVDQLWHKKYALRKTMIPSFISHVQATRILLTGKSINFLRQLCRDRTRFADAISVKRAHADAESMINQAEDKRFDRFIIATYRETSQYLLRILREKYNLHEHLKALRRYLLLGQGDFIRYLMDSLCNELDRPAETLHQHNLTGVLDSAVRFTNAQFDDADILARLDVRLLEVSPGEVGWDVFSLDYHVDGPISTVFTMECMNLYLRAFNFLWRVQRMEYILSSVWKDQVYCFWRLRSIPEVYPVLHQLNRLAAEMGHFVKQVQYYINFEVLECCWDELARKVEESPDLDHIIAAHQAFLDAILTCSFLTETPSNKALMTKLRAVFDLIIQLQQLQEALFSACLEQVRTENGEDPTSEGKSVTRSNFIQKSSIVVSTEGNSEQRTRLVSVLIPQKRTQLQILSNAYQETVRNFILLLYRDPDENLRFLSIRVDFNEHYRRKDSRLRSPRSAPMKVTLPT